ncbi:MAG: prepilin-type N-terminal cleavage/methylation domain-containing protein [Candidatus Paceibacteria bacterium]|jgi:prepilin-type N-terminal cleavage/methylation domain-containing protein
MKSSKHKKGFTLIELLVVVAIIGILASIVLASLSDARTRAQDAKIRTTMSQMRTQAEIFYSDNGSYRGTDTDGFSGNAENNCRDANNNAGGVLGSETDGSISALMNSVIDISLGTATRIYCGASADTGTDSWFFAAPLANPETGSTGLCVDHMGQVNETNASFESNNISTFGTISAGWLCA